jgi:ABC-type polysaccharide/polyol phosphate transport system ATPase subunit
VADHLVQFQAVSKCFRVGRDRGVGAVLRSLRTPRRKRAAARADRLWALKDVSLWAGPGDVIGLVGRNGSGKSTLLKLAARVITPTLGSIDVRGRVAPMLELGTGFHPMLTGRENVYLNAALFGLSRAETDRRFEAIVDYSGVAAFIDAPMTQYSSGMQARLGFSVATQVPADILLIDEVLAVGDISFRAKCIETMKELANQGRIVFFVSHEMQLVREMCTRALLVEGGAVAASGRPKEVVDVYHALMAEESGAIARDVAGRDQPSDVEVTKLAAAERYGSGGATVLSTRVLGSGMTPKRVLDSGERSRIEVRVRFNEDVDHLLVGIAIRNRQGVDVYMTNSVWQGIELTEPRAGDVWQYDFDQEMWLAHGAYAVSVAVSKYFSADRVQRLDWVGDAVQFSVFSDSKVAGYANLNSQITAVAEPRGQ